MFLELIKVHYNLAVIQLYLWSNLIIVITLARVFVNQAIGWSAEMYQQLFYTIFRLSENCGYPVQWNYIYRRGFYAVFMDIDSVQAKGRVYYRYNEDRVKI